MFSCSYFPISPSVKWVLIHSYLLIPLAFCVSKCEKDLTGLRHSPGKVYTQPRCAGTQINCRIPPCREASRWTCFPLFLGGRNCRNQRNGQRSCRTKDKFQRVESGSFPNGRPQSQDRRSGPDCCHPASQNTGDSFGSDGGLPASQTRVGDTQQESLQQVKHSVLNADSGIQTHQM